MKNQRSRIKMAFVILLIVSVGTFGVSTYVSAAGKAKTSCTNRVTFSNVSLPDECRNVTLASAKKVNNTNYGRFRISNYTRCNAIDCWMRTYYAGGWHYWTDYFVNDVSDKAVHKVRYCDKSSSFYKKGVRANLRAENAKSTVSIFKNRIKVSGVVRFN